MRLSNLPLALRGSLSMKSTEPRPFVASHLVAHPFDEPDLIERAALAFDNDGFDRLAPLLVGDADDCTFDDVRVAVTQLELCYSAFALAACATSLTSKQAVDFSKAADGIPVELAKHW